MSRFLAHGQKLLTEESHRLQALIPALEAAGAFERLCERVEQTLARGGKVVVVGLGKSGHIGRKIAATLTSTGSVAVFLHAAEALHGDLGVIQAQDMVLALAVSGETSEVLSVAQYAKKHGNPLAAITFKEDSSLARQADVVLVLPQSTEADPLGVVPTSSSLLTLAVGHGVAIALMQERNFTHQDFAEVHPGGQLGLSLTAVAKLICTWNHPPLTGDSTLLEVTRALDAHNYGIAAVLHPQSSKLKGAVSDGDLRRHLLSKGAQAFEVPLSQWMSPHPKTIFAHQKLKEAVEMMRSYSITSLFVLKDQDSKELLGLIRLHDILRSSKITHSKPQADKAL